MALSALVLAAMGSHLVDMNGMQRMWDTASQIHLFSAASLLGLVALLAWLKSPLIRWGAWLIILGTLIFCGSIYLHVISGLTVKNLTPAGGLMMMTGWVLTALAFLRRS
jgi:uncharacterized membrane protein YgdD (TMEM256/DUF423 family)